MDITPFTLVGPLIATSEGRVAIDQWRRQTSLSRASADLRQQWATLGPERLPGRHRIRRRTIGVGTRATKPTAHGRPGCLSHSGFLEHPSDEIRDAGCR